MNLCKDDPGNKIGHGLIIFMAFFAFMTLHVPRVKTMVYADVLGQEADIDGEKIGTLKDQSTDKRIMVFEVNGETFTIQELLKRYDFFLIMSGYSEKHRERVRLDEYHDNYILELLLLQEAAKTGIRVGRDEVEKEKKVYLTRAGLTEETLSGNLLKAGLTMEDAERYFEDHLIIKRLGNKKFGDMVPISDEESLEFYSSNNEYFNTPEKITASHILICHKESRGCKSDFTRQRAKERAEYIRKLVTPDNFSSLAKRYSMDPTGAIGGALGDIYRGTAVPSFEEAAFRLDTGEISDVIESDFGYHIIYVTGKQEARAVTFEEAKESIKRDIKEERISLKLLNYSKQLRKSADIERYAVAGGEGKGSATKTQAPVETVNVLSSSHTPPTFRDTGEDICTNDEGQPVVILFGSSRCSHCEWIAETFDSTVMEYVKLGLIEAHHYNMDTDDDLMTPNLENVIPKRYLKIIEQGDPEGYVPYFNFGCSYDRIGTGYEGQDNLFAEEMEMRKVLNALVR